MTTLQGWRKAVGALKDSTTVGLANLNSDYKVRSGGLGLLLSVSGFSQI